MPLIPRIRFDLAIGLIVAGTIWYIGTRPRYPPSHNQDEEDEAEVDALTLEPSEKIIEGSLEALKPLLMEPTLLERIVLASDPKTMIRIAQVSKYHNEFITSSPSIQLLLRNYYHQLPPISYPSAQQRNYLTRTPKKRQLDDLLDREERLSRFKHTKFQRCVMPYIDVLCSGDYTIVTRCLSGKYREEGNVESGQVEDGYTVMVPRDPTEPVEEQEGQEEEGDRPKRRDRLEGYVQRTVDVGEEIADIGVRADEDLIIIATIVPEDQLVSQDLGPKPKVIRISFYHLEAYTPQSPSSEFAIPTPHSGAKLQVAEFALTTPFTSIRLRAGPQGELLIWAKNDRDRADTTALIYDWKLGMIIGHAWPKNLGDGIPHDFTFFTPEILILAVLKTATPGTNGSTPTDRTDATRLEVQTWRLPGTSLYANSTKRLTAPTKESHENNGFDCDAISPTTHCQLESIYKFPSFTYKWKNPTPMEDEIPNDEGQTFSLFHCSIAAKPAPVSYGDAQDQRQGILCVTIEGDFGPFTHPNGPPHDHGAIAFCTVSGSAFTTTHTNKQSPAVYEYEEWNEGNVSWEFGPLNTWVTGFGTRTALVTRFVGIEQSQLMNEDLEWEDEEPKRALVMNVTLRNYDPIAVVKKGRISRQALGGPLSSPLCDSTSTSTSASASTSASPANQTQTGVLDTSEPDPDSTAPLRQAAQDLDELFGNLANTFPIPIPQAPPGLAANPLHQLSDLIRQMNSAAGATAFRVIKAIDHGPRPEIFGEYGIKSTMPYYEVNIGLPVPTPEGNGDGEETRDEAAMDHPFKTILARDRLIVCDDAGFDVISI